MSYGGTTKNLLATTASSADLAVDSDGDILIILKQ
jgi:hypothetical protein